MTGKLQFSRLDQDESIGQASRDFWIWFRMIVRMNGTVTNWMTTSDCLICSTQQSGILDDYNLTMNYHDDAQLPLRDNIFLHALSNNDVMHIYMISDILFIALRVLCLLKKAVPVRTYSVNYPMYNARYLQFSGRKRSLNILLSSTKQSSQYNAAPYTANPQK
jgi:hypothetical protein